MRHRQQQFGDTHALILSLANLASIHLAMDEPQTSLRYSLEANAVNAVHPIKLYPAYALVANTAAGYEEVGKLDSADRYYRLALDSAHVRSNRMNQAVLYANYGNFLVSQGDPSGLQYDEQSLALMETLPRDMAWQTNMTMVAEDYLKLGFPAKAKNILEQTLPDSAFTYSHYSTPKLFSQIYEALGDPAEALRQYKRYVAQRDSSERHEKEEVQALVDQFQQERDQAELQRLRLENDLQQAENRRKNTQNIALLATSVLLLALLTIVFVFLQRNRASRQLLAEKNRELELERQQLEFKALLPQIKPHFVFNALNSIQRFIAKNDRTSSFAYLGRFGELFRTVLEHSSQRFVALHEELDALTNYVEIEKLRIDKPFAFTIAVAPDLDPYEMTIPPMLIQPFLENALWHGLPTATAAGKIHLSMTRQGEMIRIQLDDNGAGYSWEPEPGQHTSGISITHQRLKALWAQGKHPRQLSIAPLPDGG
ncbi:MAG: histidine kinase, partial [Bacteroidota bacterium]